MFLYQCLITVYNVQYLFIVSEFYTCIYNALLHNKSSCWFICTDDNIDLSVRLCFLCFSMSDCPKTFPNCSVIIVNSHKEFCQFTCYRSFYLFLNCILGTKFQTIHWLCKTCIEILCNLLRIYKYEVKNGWP